MARLRMSLARLILAVSPALVVIIDIGRRW
jgi:hypothetical protein